MQRSMRLEKDISSFSLWKAATPDSASLCYWIWLDWKCETSVIQKFHSRASNHSTRGVAPEPVWDRNRFQPLPSTNRIIKRDLILFYWTTILLVLNYCRCFGVFFSVVYECGKLYSPPENTRNSEAALSMEGVREILQRCTSAHQLENTLVTRKRYRRSLYKGVPGSLRRCTFGGFPISKRSSNPFSRHIFR